MEESISLRCITLHFELKEAGYKARHLEILVHFFMTKIGQELAPNRSSSSLNSRPHRFSIPFMGLGLG
jgi:hypothetical protein